MRIAILHLSDFHIHDRDRILSQKINGILSSLNVLERVDDYIVVFSGDLSYSGQINEFKTSRYFWGRIIRGIKEKNGNRYVHLFMVPGNHDLCLPQNARGREEIQDHYDHGTIEDLIPQEETYLDNYYNYSNTSGKKPFDFFLSKKHYVFGGYKIQFNLINSAPFSTLKPDDKELHYFPDSKMDLLERVADTNLCITVMHHSYEWFNWNYKSSLEKVIIDNSEFLFLGHDHREKTAVLSINDSMNTCISSAGEMRLSSLDAVDSYNILVIDTEENTFDGYVFTWEKHEKIYTHKTIAEHKSFQNHSAVLMPLPSFIKGLKEDTYNLSDDFTKYFVFPKIVSESQNDNDNKYKTISSVDDFLQFLFEKKRLIVSGSPNSGKTTLMKYLYCALMGEKVPLLFSADTKQRVKANSFIRHLFEEQYSDDRTMFERYEQLDIDKKVLLIDGWDSLTFSKNKAAVFQKIEESFGYVVISVSNIRTNIVETIKEELGSSIQYIELNIKPFFAEKRNELIRNICLQKDIFNNNNIDHVIRLIDSLVHNNSGLFLLNPAFIVRYTNCFIQDPYQDYAKGEAVFSKIFEFELSQSIIMYAKRQDVDEIFTVFEEIAGYMYTNRKDELLIEEIRTVVEMYNNAYGEHVNVKDIVNIGVQTKILRETAGLSVFFSNKNHFSYFIAKYLIRASQGDPPDYRGIKYALENICFGINDDIVLFISYILNNTKILSFISSYAGELLTPWEAVDFSKKNVTIFSNMQAEQIGPPTEEDRNTYENAKEKSEELILSDDIIEARGIFDYDTNDINQFQYRLIRAIRYTEMICKALPAFHSKLKIEQKKELVESIFLYPRKIIYAMLHPLEMELKEASAELFAYVDQNNIRKKNGKKYVEDDIVRMLKDAARARMLDLLDHFAELATSPKSIEILLEQQPEDISEQLERLLIIENSGNTDRLVKDAETLLKDYRQTEYDPMIRLIVWKHLVINKNLPFRKRQQAIDKIFGKENRKLFLPGNN